MNFIALLVFSLSLTARGEVLEDFDAQAVRDGFAQTSLCGTRETAAACRGLPWAPGIGEGIFIVGSKGYILLRKDKNNSEFNELAARFSSDKRDEYATLLATVKNDPDGMLGSVGVGTIFICWVNVTNGEITFDSVTKIDLRELILFKSSRTIQFLSELKSAAGLWTPPENFFPKYEFAYVR